MLTKRNVASLLTLAITGFVACSSEDLDDRANRPRMGEEADGGGDPLGTIPFEPVGPSVYVPKVKNLLTGLAATDDEVKAVTADPNALRGLIDQWMTLPSFKVRMLDFFRNAFQQNQVTVDALQAATRGLNNVNFVDTNTMSAKAQMARNLMDSFGLTAWKLMEEGRPFTETVTTRRYMVTTALLGLISYIDDNNANDRNQITNRLIAQNRIPSYTVETTSAIPYEESAKVGGPNFMRWSIPTAQPGGCTAATTQTFNAIGADTRPDGQFYSRLFSLFMGRTVFNPCGADQSPTMNTPPVYGDSDWNDWRMVTFNVDPAAPGASIPFYDLAGLRSATAITIHVDRVGFIGTPAFAANWATNPANDARVTANQSLIVALGQSVAGEDSLTTFPVNATDADHASNPACKACHDQLDPFKTFFRQSYSLNYGEQTDPKVLAQQAGFSYAGQNATGKGIGDLANIMVANPHYPIAWVNKLHFWANSVPVIESDPEAVRIAEAFKSSAFDFKTLVRELFSSPLITWSRATTTTTTNGVIVSIARRDQFCSALSTRLGLDDLCGMTAIKRTTQQADIANRALLMPVDTYYRAYALPSLPTNPDLFYRQSTEAICALVADQVIDVKAPGSSKYLSTDPDGAIADFVTTVMGVVPSDPKHAKSIEILKDNYAKSIEAGSQPTESLKATFALACLSPSSVIVGL